MKNGHHWNLLVFIHKHHLHNMNVQEAIGGSSTFSPSTTRLTAKGVTGANARAPSAQRNATENNNVRHLFIVARSGTMWILWWVRLLTFGRFVPQTGYNDMRAVPDYTPKRITTECVGLGDVERMMVFTVWSFSLLAWLQDSHRMTIWISDVVMTMMTEKHYTHWRPRDVKQSTKEVQDPWS